MPPILFPMYGPIAIHSFGTMIAIGVTIALYLLHRDTIIQKYVTDEQLATIFELSFCAGIAGGRIWFCMTNPQPIIHWTEYFTFWAGGLSISGAIIGIIATLSTYFYYYQLPGLLIADRMALYGILAQSISRLGCFFAGCCYGKCTTLPWAIIYTHHDSLAPLNVYLHPTQLYSCILLGLGFVLLYLFDRYARHKQPGQLLALYLICSSFDRFIVDFFRDDQEFFINNGILQGLSIQQVVAFALYLAGISAMIFFSLARKTDESI